MSLTADTPRSSISEAIAVQSRVIGALIMRELHTRYGRDNIGYLWVVLEPMTLASAVAVLHTGQATHFGSDIRPVPFSILGYTIFITFRSIVGRSEGALHANLPLLYHRMVTVFDLLFSRALLEGAGTTATLALLLGVTWVTGMGGPPVQLWAILLAIFLMLWMSFGVSMLICVGSYMNKSFAKFVHPVLYILMPLSGSFYVVDWLTEPYRSYATWMPTVGIFELARYGLFNSASWEHVDLGYVVSWCLALTLAGLLSLEIVRRKVHLS